MGLRSRAPCGARGASLLNGVLQQIITRFATYFNIMSRQFSEATAFLWHHLYLDTIVNENPPP